MTMMNKDDRLDAGVANPCSTTRNHNVVPERMAFEGFLSVIADEIQMHISTYMTRKGGLGEASQL
jgi:hypothetical protein